MMNLKIFLMAATALMATIAAATAADEKPLNPRLAKAVEEIADSYQNGDSSRLYRDLSRTASRLKEKQLEAVDLALAEREIPGVGELLVKLRLRLVEQGRAGALPKPTFRERMLVLEGLLERVNEYLETTEKHPVVAGTLPHPRTFNEFRDVLWMLHVIENRLLSAQRCAEHAAELARKLGPRTRKRLSESDNELIRACESDAAKTIERQQQAVEELEMELRLERLDLSLKALENPELTKDRFLAAHGANIDARILTDFLNEKAGSKASSDVQGDAGDSRTPAEPPQFLRPALNRPDLADEVVEQAQRARQLAGDLATKANDFFEGLHWWLRGRYGEGPEVWGLAKSEEVLNDPSQLVWLYMPSEIPFPTDPAEDGITQVPRFERRHLYTWAWEDRKFQRDAASDSGIAGRKEYELPFFW